MDIRDEGVDKGDIRTAFEVQTFHIFAQRRTMHPAAVEDDVVGGLEQY